jgi:hypothetical protein
MKRTVLALIAPPASVARFGCVSCTAAPIGVFWLTSLTSIGYGLANSVGGLVAAGALLWLIAAVWARLVIRGVESDLLHREDSTQAHQAIPRLDEPDPFSQLRTHS